MADKIEYSRLLMKRSTQSGEVPTVPPITAVTLNQFTPTDVFVGEFFLNAVDDLLWIRTDNGILPIDLSGSTGTTIPSLNQVLFQGNITNGIDIQVSSGDTITYGGLVTGSTTNFLGLDASGNTIVSGVVPGTPDLSQVLFQGNQTNGTDIEVSSGDTIQFLGLSSGSTTDILGVDASGNTIITTVSGGVSGEYLPLSGGTVTGNTYFGATSGITMDQVNNRIGVNTSAPEYYVDLFGTKSRIYYADTSGGVLQMTGDTFLPRYSIAAAATITKPLFSLSMGVRTWDDTTFPGYGKIGDTFIYSSNEANGMNIINRQGTGTEDYIRFYAGQDANGTTPDIHIQGSGATRGYVGIGTINPTQPLDVAGNTRVGGNLILRTIGSGTSVINLGLDSSGVVVTGTTGGASVVKSGDGVETIIANYLPTNYAPDDYMNIIAKTNAASSGQYSSVWGGRNNKTNNQFGAVVGGYSNTAGYICGVFAGGNNNATGNSSAIIGGENNTINNATYFGMLAGYNNYATMSNDNGNAMIAGHSNYFSANGVQGNSIIGGRSNSWYHFDSRDPVIGAPRYGLGSMIGGYQNIIAGLAGTASGSHAFPLLFGGRSNELRGEESNDSATSGCSIINSYSSTIIGPTLLSAHFETSGSTISGRTQAVMIGTTNRTADADNTTYVENFKTFGNVEVQGQSYVALPATGTTTSATTINWNDGNVQEKVLNVSATTLTFTNANAGGTYILILKQSSAGSYTVTFPGSVSWAGGTPPTMSTSPNRYDVYTFIYDGNKYFGSFIQDFP